jgi:hypothetical protein
VKRAATRGGVVLEFELREARRACVRDPTAVLEEGGRACPGRVIF